MSILRNFCEELGHTLIVVTHDANVAAYANRVIFMHDGKICDTLNLKNSSLKDNEVVRIIASKIEELSL